MLSGVLEVEEFSECAEVDEGEGRMSGAALREALAIKTRIFKEGKRVGVCNSTF